MKTFYKAVLMDIEVMVYRTKKEALKACVNEDDHIIEFRGEESERGYVYDPENDATYSIDENCSGDESAHSLSAGGNSGG